jgi:hypothetical protein
LSFAKREKGQIYFPDWVLAQPAIFSKGNRCFVHEFWLRRERAVVTI